MTEYEQRQIAEAIARVERRTDAELVTVLARRADDYAYWPCSGPPCWRWSSRCCCTGCWAGRPAWPAGGQCCLFVALCLLLRHPRLAGWLMPAILRRRVLPRLPGSSFASSTCSAPPGPPGC
jgi:putative membrane protein